MQFAVKYYLYCSGMFGKILTWQQAYFTYFCPCCFRSSHLGLLQKIQKFIKKLSIFIGMWRINLISHKKIIENSWKYLIFQNTNKTVSTYTPHRSPTNCNFYELDIFAEVYDVSWPKKAFFHKFWLKGHEKLLSTTKFECV